MTDFSCPIPSAEHPQITMAHGGGGRLTAQLIERLFRPAFANAHLEQQHDGAALELPGGRGRVAFTTDSYVVQPLEFPGGDIGTLAVNGTVNDLAMCGARPLHLSAAFIIEEGLPAETLGRIALSMSRAAAAAGVTVVTGDTKVVNRGHGDGLFITTAGIGVIEHGLEIGPGRVRAGDAVIVSGDLGRHGIAIMSVREGLEFETAIESDCAPLAGPVRALLEAGLEVHCLRDLTRGGLSSALNEIAEAGGVRIQVDEAWIPVMEQVRGACEILGLDPLYVANEGRFIVILPEAEAGRAVENLRANGCAEAVRIGEVAAGGQGTGAPVTLKSRIGVARVLAMLSGEQLPRIC